MLGEEGSGFAIAQARLGPGRIHHCMRAIGMAERAFDLMCERAHARTTFGKPLARQGVIREWIAESRIEIEQARLLVLKTAWLMDNAGNKGARIEISAIKVAAPEVAVRVIDRAIQVHGGGGRQQRLPARGDVRGRAHAADRRRPRRGAQALDRAPRAAPLRAAARSRRLAGRGRMPKVLYEKRDRDRVRDAEPARGEERDRPRDRTSCCGRRGRTSATTTRSTSRS